MIYRKFCEKSRCQAAGSPQGGSSLAQKITGIVKGWNKKKTDIFLIVSLAVLSLVFLITHLVNNNRHLLPAWTELQMSELWETVFDSESLGLLIAEFEELNPQLRIKQAMPEKTPGAADASIANNASRGSPDIILMDDSLLSKLIREKEIIFLDSADSENSGQWAIPLLLSMDMLFYNIDLLMAAGFDRPPKTRDDFLRYARAVSARPGGIYGTALGLSREDPHAIQRDVFSWLWAAGYDVIRDNKPVFDRAVMTDLFSFLAQANRTGIPGENAFEITGAQRLQEFAQGKLAMIAAPAQEIAFLREHPVNFGVTNIPGGNVPGKNTLGLSGYYMGISGSCAHPDEARQFLSFLEEKSLVLNAKIKTVPGQLHGSLPAARGFTGHFLDEDEFYAKAWDIFESSGIAATFSGYPLAHELEQVIREELSNHFNSSTSLSEAVSAVQNRWIESILLLEDLL